MIVPVRAVVLAAALAAAAWLALGLRSAELRRHAYVVAVAERPSAAQVAAARADLRAARVGVPDGLPVSVEATLLVNAGARRDAAAALERLVRLEPDNPIMWLLLYRGPVSPERRAEAQDRLRHLAPPAPR